MEPITYANGSTLDDPAISYGIVFSNFMSRGVYVFSGGTDLLISEMKGELRRHGVELRNHALVERVIVEHGRCRGVVANGREIRARAVISNAHLLNTIFELLDAERELDREFVARARAVRRNNSSCQVYIGLAKGATIDYCGDLFFTSSAPTYRAEDLLRKKAVSRTFSFYYPEMRPAGPPRYAIVSSTNAAYEDWVTGDAASYARDKQELIDDTLVALESYLPGITHKIDHVEAATPRTFEHYTRHVGGASFGTKFEGLAVSFELPERLPGYYHAGSCGIIMSGWLGAANYGVIVADKVDRHLDTPAAR
jgi:phytoene dehydrogenase-like protein